MSDKFLIKAISDYEELAKVRDFVFDHAILFGFSDEEASNISLAVDEACSNLIRHAFRMERNHNLAIKIESENNKFIVNILDDGEPFNPLDYGQPNMIDYFKNFQKGGLGIQIMRSVMDEISYSPADRKTKKNTLKLIKLLSA